MAIEDQARWDDKYGRIDTTGLEAGLPETLMPFEELLSGHARALEIACGSGRIAVWLATQGTTVDAYDISAVAIKQARNLAARSSAPQRCTFEVADLDDGLPPGPSVDLVVCTLFRDAALDAQIIDRLKPGGYLAMTCLSEVGAEPGRFRTKPGELAAAFDRLELIAHKEGNGVALLVARKP